MTDEEFVNIMMAIPIEELIVLDRLCKCEALCTCIWTQDDDKLQEGTAP
jgi:hypothetical protein